MATAEVYASLPIRASALKQLLKTIDPATIAEEERRAAEQLLKKNANKKKKKSVARSDTPKKKVEPRKTQFLETPPTSPEPEEKKTKPRFGGGRDIDRNLFTELHKVVATRPRKIPRKKRVVYSDEDTEEEEERAPPRDMTWFEGIATPEDLSIEKLRPQGKYFLGKYKILNVVDVDETRGATYIAYRNGYEVVLRVNFIQKDEMELMNTEAKFLEMMELNDAQHFFSTLYDMGLVNKHKADGKFYYATIYRGGPTLEQCHVLCKTTCTSGTVDRLAAHMVKIFEQIFGQGYRILSFALEDFKIDPRSRVVYLDNYANIVKAAGDDYDDIDEEEFVDLTDKKRRVAWEGGEDFAPIKWHQDGEDHVMSEMDSIESLVYLLVYMHTGALPWTGQEDKVKWKQVHADENQGLGALINDLPPSLKCLWGMVHALDSTRVSFPLVHRMFTRYSDDNEEFLYDWESPISPSDDQEALICLKDIIDDTKRKMGALECIFDNEELLSKR